MTLLFDEAALCGWGPRTGESSGETSECGGRWFGFGGVGMGSWRRWWDGSAAREECGRWGTSGVEGQGMARLGDELRNSGRFNGGEDFRACVGGVCVWSCAGVGVGVGSGVGVVGRMDCWTSTDSCSVEACGVGVCGRKVG